jgi:hypothetical protein
MIAREMRFPEAEIEYLQGMPPRQAAREIRKGIGTQFSGPAAEAFLKVFERDPVLQGRSSSH